MLGTALTWFLIDQTDAATGAFKSARARALMGLGGVVWVGLRLGLARFVSRLGLRTLVMAVAAFAVLAVVVLPAYDDETVVEAFPAATADAAAAGPAAPDPSLGSADRVETSAATAPPAKVPTASTAAARSSAPAAPTPAAPAVGSPASEPPTTEPTTAAPTTPAPTTTDPAVAADPVLLRTGTFRGIDHEAEGTVKLYRRADGRIVVGLEDFDIQPGPDYDVYLVPATDRRDTGDGIRLGDLRGNKGTQFYETPDGFDLGTGPWTVLIWCQTFGVPVANSTPA